MAVNSQPRVISEGLVRLFAAARGEDGPGLWWPFSKRALMFLHPGMSQTRWEKMLWKHLWTLPVAGPRRTRASLAP
jgi:hypothetical protein